VIVGAGISALARQIKSTLEHFDSRTRRACFLHDHVAIPVPSHEG